MITLKYKLKDDDEDKRQSKENLRIHKTRAKKIWLLAGHF